MSTGLPAGERPTREAESVPGHEVESDGGRGRAAIDFLGKCVHHAAWRFRLLEYAWTLVEREIDSASPVPWRKRFALWRRGFLSESAILYGFPHNDSRLYLSDYARGVKTRRINGAYGVLLDDKLLFARLLRDHARYLPTVFGVLRNGRIVPALGVGAPVSDATLHDLLARKRAVVLKPVNGGGGAGVVVLQIDGDGVLRMNGAAIGPAALHDVAAACDGHLACALLRQHPALARIYPHTTNSVRILTMHDDDGVFIAATVLRIGCGRSRPTDNWGRGGMAASIDPHTGRLGRAASYCADEAALHWHSHHPESGAPIEGAVLPHWRLMRDVILGIAQSLPFLPYIGWDVAMTEDGFRILEGNKYSDVHILQVHKPLLADGRVRAFYRSHGAIGGKPGKDSG